MSLKKLTFEPYPSFMTPNRFGTRREVQFAFLLSGFLFYKGVTWLKRGKYGNAIPTFQTHSNLYEEFQLNQFFKQIFLQIYFLNRGYIMGNSVGKQLELKYQQQNYQIIGSKQDKYIGAFAIWKFYLSKEIICMYKIFDPNQYEEQSGIQDIINNMFSEQKSICDFYMVKENRQNQDLYDLVFEFGNQIDLPFTKEKYIWILLDQITEAMIKIEDKGFHYTFLHLNYIVQLEKKIFKLVNPYCFSDFIKDVLRIYTNPQVLVSQRKQFQTKNIRKNIQQLGNLVITLLGDFDDSQIYSNIIYRNHCMQQVQSNISKELLSFLKYVFYDLGQITPSSFKQIKKFLENNKPKKSSRFIKKIIGAKNQKLDYYKPTTDQKQKTQQYLIFDSNRNLSQKQPVKNQLNDNFSMNYTQQKQSQPIQNLSSFYMDEFSYQDQQVTQPQQNKVKMNIFQNNFMNDPKFNKPYQANYNQQQSTNYQQNPYQNEDNFYQQDNEQININQTQMNQNKQEEFSQKKYQDQNFLKQDNNFNNDENDNDFFKKNTYPLAEQNDPSIQQNNKEEKADNFFDNNGQDTLNSNEQQIDYFNENAPFQQQNFFESIQDEKHLEVDNNQQKKRDVKQALFQEKPQDDTQNQTLDKINSTGEIYSDEEQNQYYDDTSSQNSNQEEIQKKPNKIKVKEIFRQNLHEQGYKKYHIYDDGTEEEVEMNQQEKNLLMPQNNSTNNSNLQQQRDVAKKQLEQNLLEQPSLYYSQENQLIQGQQQQSKSNQDQQNQNIFYSHYQQNNFMPDFVPPPNLLEDLDQTESIDITLMDKENNMHFILYPGERMNPQVLFRKKTQKNYNFDEIQKVVDFQNKMKPSMYHQIEVDDGKFEIDPQTDAQQCISKINPSLKGTLKSRQTLIKSKFQLMSYNQFKYISFLCL